MKTETLLKLPWTWKGPRKVTEEGVTYWVVTVEELEGFVVAGETSEEVEQERTDALAQFLQSYVDDGELPPLPRWKVSMPGSSDVTARPFDFTDVDATVTDTDLQLA